jgi:UDP-N-acetylglucosamine 2-epimerase
MTGHRAEAGHIDSIARGMREHGGVRVMPYTFSGDTTSDTLAGQARAMFEACGTMTDVLVRLAPDFVIVYGDRGEAFAMALAASRMGIPVAHVEGGDTTEGHALDDNARHAITRLSALHFPTTGHAAAQLEAMGEEAWRVKACGVPILDLVAAGDYTPPDVVRARYGLGAEPF